MIMLRQGRLFVLLPEQHRVGLGGEGALLAFSHVMVQTFKNWKVSNLFVQD